MRTNEIFGEFPHPLAKSSQTDMLALLPIDYRVQAWQWMNEVVETAQQGSFKSQVFSELFRAEGITGNQPKEQVLEPISMFMIGFHNGLDFLALRIVWHPSCRVGHQFL